MRIIFLLFGIFVVCNGQFIQYSPCPNIFKYKSRSDQYKYGLVTVPSPPIGEPVVPLNLLFSLRSRLPTKYGGLIELLGTRREAIEKILDHEPIRFLIHFPMQSPLPKLELISYQNDILCSSEPEYNMYNVDQRKSIIEFRYSFNTTGLISQTTVPPPPPPPLFHGWPSIISTSPPPLHFTNEPNDIELLSEYQNEIVTPTRKSKKISSTLLESDQNKECGQQDKRFLTSPLIAGGKSIEHGAWPWLSAIYIVKSSGLQFICTGNLISPTTVITSAHCFDYDQITKRSRSDIMVFLGRHNLSEWMEKGTEMRRISELHIHPEYHINSNNDANIAIIILKNPINYSVYIRPICLWNSINVENDDTDILSGSIGVLVGWGSDARSMRLATIPQRINIEIIDKDLCFKSNPTIFQTLLTNRTICGGQADGLSGPCHGDSGAGLAILKNGRMMLRGLVGVGITNPANLCDLTQYSVYTDLTKFSTWIKEIMEKENN